MDPSPKPYGSKSKTLWILVQNLKDLVPLPGGRKDVLNSTTR